MLDRTLQQRSLRSAKIKAAHRNQTKRPRFQTVRYNNLNSAAIQMKFTVIIRQQSKFTD